MLATKLMAAAKSATTPTFIASASGASTGSTTLTINKPTGTIDGDLMFFMAGADATNQDAATWALPAGWTEVYDSAQKTALVIGYKIASSEGESYSFTCSLSKNLSGHIVTYRNAKPVLAGAASFESNGDPNCGGVSIPVANCVILAALSSRQDASITWTPPAGFSSLVADSNATTPSTAIFSYDNPSLGATGTKTFTSAAGDASGILFLIVPQSYNPLSFVASEKTQNTSAGSSLVINKPTGTVENDIMIAVMAADGTASTWTGDTNWTEIADQGATSPSLRIAYRVAGASEGSSYTFTNASTSRRLGGTILTYRYAAYDTIAASFTTGANPLVLTGVTVSGDIAMLIAVGARNSVGITLGTPTNMTARVTDSDGNGPSYIVCDQLVPLGATNTRSISTGSITNVAGIMLSINNT